MPRAGHNDSLVPRTRAHTVAAIARWLRRAAAVYPARSAFALRLEALAAWVEHAIGRRRRAARLAAAARHPAEHAPRDWTPPLARPPLVLITQAARSGGTLLLRLLDGHPGCLVVPHELSSMLPTGPLPRDPAAAFDLLTPKYVYAWHERGIRVGKSGLSGKRSHQVEFRLPPPVFARIFRDLAAGDDDRAVLDAYFTAYFAAWVDGPAPGPNTRWLVGFEPWAVAERTRLQRFGQNYEDGRIISVIRDPWTWFVSASRWNSRFADRKVAVHRWLQAAEATLALRDAQPSRIHLLLFDDLVLRTRETMESVCRFLELPFGETLVTPTLNGRPADANSSFRDVVDGISRAPAVERRSRLSAHDEGAITAAAGETWERIVAAAALRDASGL